MYYYIAYDNKQLYLQSVSMETHKQ